MRYIPFLILIYIWLIIGRADPGDLLQGLPFIRWLTYALIPLLLCSGFCYVAIKGRIIRTVVDSQVFLLILLIASSTYLNEVHSMDLFYGIGVYLRYPLLFILFCNIPQMTSKGREFVSFSGVVVALLILEAIVNVIFFGKYQDQTFFTLGITWGTSNAGVFFAVCIAWIYAHALLTSWRFFHFLILALIIAVAQIASIRALFPIVVCLFFIILAIHKRRLTSKGLFSICIIFNIAVFLTAFFDWYSFFLSSSFLSRFDPGYRFEYIREVLIHIRDSGGNLLIGTGPMSMHTGSVDSAGSIYSYFLYYRGNILHLGSNQYVKGITELGVVGMLVYWYMLYQILGRAWGNWVLIRDSLVAPVWLKVVNLSFFGVWSFYAFLGLFANDLWRMDSSSFFFWFFAATIANFYRHECRQGRLSSLLKGGQNW